MNFRHATVLALAGWYLMIPPINQNGQIVSEVPLSKWRIAQSFDSATKCQEWLSDFRDRAKTEESHKAKGMSKTWSDAQWQDWLQASLVNAAMEESLCIATDDPRLKGD